MAANHATNYIVQLQTCSFCITNHFEKDKKTNK